MEVENPVNFFAEIVTKRYLLKITNLYIESIEKTCILGLPLNLPPLTFELHMYNMAIRVVEFSNGGYKIRKIFA